MKIQRNSNYILRLLKQIKIKIRDMYYHYRYELCYKGYWKLVYLYRYYYTPGKYSVKNDPDGYQAIKKAIFDYLEACEKKKHVEKKQTGRKINHKHPFHLVDPSPWPIFTSLSAFFTTFGLVLYIHGYDSGFNLLNLGLFLLCLVAGLWWRDVIREATFEGIHTKRVQKGLRLGIGLFIASEVIFFFAFFWAFFHSSLSPVFQIGGVWPPVGIHPINPWGIPFLNTLLLLCSGFTLTWAHHALRAGGKKQGLIGLSFTLILAVLFTSLQVFEYKTASFSISDGIYGSVFYMATGFHGFHVFIGTIFIGICGLRLFFNHFTRTHHFGFEAASWYWHFVDVVWLFLFVCIYWWGS